MEENLSINLSIQVAYKFLEEKNLRFTKKGKEFEGALTSIIDGSIFHRNFNWANGLIDKFKNAQMWTKEDVERAYYRYDDNEQNDVQGFISY
jgi:hypothetical protein